MTADQFVQTTLGGLAIGCIYSLIALGISMIIRATDILHFAQGEMLMIGSMMGLSAYWLHGMPFVLVLLAGSASSIRATRTPPSSDVAFRTIPRGHSKPSFVRNARTFTRTRF